ncbi:MAG: hypothetical protein QM764_22110 [Chitinophagaceae bacterium]
MKKILILGNLGWLLIFALFLTKCNDASIAYQPVCINCVTDNFSGVEAGKLMKGLARYRKYQFNASNREINAALNSGASFQDARSCWYSLDTLKKFICLIEKYSSSDKLRFTSKDLGIRFYYATYDRSVYDSFAIVARAGGDRIGRDSLGLHHTLFMVPTYRDSGLKLDVDFDPRLSAGVSIETINQGFTSIDAITRPGFDQLFIWNNYITNPAQKLLVLDHEALSSTTPSAKNQGRLCPPTCPTGTATLLGKVDATFPDNMIGTN